MRAMYEIALEYAMVPPVVAATLFVALSLFPAPFSPLFHSSRPCRATHRHHLAIHLGPVLLITRLELRTRTGTRGSPGYVSRIPLKRSRGRGHAGAHGRPPASPARAIIVLFSVPSVRSRPLFRSPPLRSFAQFSLTSSLLNANDVTLFFTQLATKGPLYAAGARVYFIRRMSFNVLHDYSRRVSRPPPARSLARSFFLSFASRSDVA